MAEPIGVAGTRPGVAKACWLNALTGDGVLYMGLRTLW